jgi:PAS domain S-box-containing protein
MGIDEQATIGMLIQHMASREQLTGEQAATHVSQGRAVDHRAIVDAISAAVVTMGQAGEIEFFNRAEEHLFGYPAAAVIGQPVTLLIPERLHTAHRLGVQRYLETRLGTIVGHRVAMPAVRRDGNEIAIVMTVCAVERGSALLFVAVMDEDTGQTYRDPHG